MKKITKNKGELPKIKLIWDSDWLAFKIMFLALKATPVTEIDGRLKKYRSLAG